MPMPSPRPAAHLPNPPQRGIGHAVAPGGLVHRANPLPVDAIGALEAQINQLHDFAEVLRQQLEATREDRDRWRQRAQHLMLELKVLSGSPWWKRLTGNLKLHEQQRHQAGRCPTSSGAASM